MHKLTYTLDQRNCDACGLYKHKRTHFVPAQVISTPVRVLFVGEGPGEDEDQMGLPFVGVSGELLRECVEAAFGSEDNVAYSNIVRCRPVRDDGRNRPPVHNEAGRCVQYLHRDIKKLKPDVIIALGRVALKHVTGIDMRAWETRGREFKAYVGDKTYKVISAFHPAYILRNPKHKRLFLSDIRKAYWEDPHKDEKRVTISTVKDVRKLVDYLLYEVKEENLGFDTETRNVNKRHNNCIYTLQFCCTNDNTAYCVPLDHPQSPFKDSPKREQVIAEMHRLFTTKNPAFKRIIIQNAKFDMQRLYGLGIRSIAAPVVCTILAAHMLDENRSGSWKLEVLADEWLGRPKYEDNEIRDKIAHLDEVDLVKVAKYGGNDAVLVRELFKAYIAEAEAQNFLDDFMRLCDSLLARTSIVLSTLEYNGFPIDLDSLRKSIDPRTSVILKRMDEITNTILPSLPNVQSTNHILVRIEHQEDGLFSEPWVFQVGGRLHRACLCFEKLKLTPNKDDEIYERNGRKFDSVPSMDSAFKKRYIEMRHKKKRKHDIQVPGESLYYDYPEIALLHEYDKLKKCMSTYMQPMWDMCSPTGAKFRDDHIDRRLRASFSGHHTVTGRNASHDPNGQNVPRGDTPAKKSVKNTFTAEDGYWLINCDFSAAEVRWLAIASGDPVLCEAFRRGKKMRDKFLKKPTPKMELLSALASDIHRQSASLFYNVSLEKVSKELRQTTKSIVFGRIYGRGIIAISGQIGETVEDTAKIVGRFDRKYKKAMGYIKACAKHAREHGWVRSLIGRRRRLQAWYEEENDAKGAAGDRMAGNSPIQSIASDCNNLATAELIKHINKHDLDWVVHSVVHDSAVMSISMQYDLVECLRTIEGIFTDGLEEILREEFGVKLGAPLSVDFEVGLKWGELSGWNGTRQSMERIQMALRKKAIDDGSYARRFLGIQHISGGHV